MPISLTPSPQGAGQFLHILYSGMNIQGGSEPEVNGTYVTLLFTFVLSNNAKVGDAVLSGDSILEHWFVASRRRPSTI